MAVQVLDPEEAGLPQADARVGRWDFSALDGSNAADRANKNAEIVQLIKTLEKEGRAATDEEARVLSSFSGWGAAANVFRPQARSADGARLKTVAEEEALAQVAGALGDEWLAAARHAILTSYYTPPEVAGAVVAALRGSGLGRGRSPMDALEPGCGSGTFLAQLDEAGGFRLFGVELDPASASVARALVPSAQVATAPFQRVALPAGSFSLAVGNVPFVSGETGEDPECGKVALHDYFVLKSVRALRPGGVAALLTSSFTLDKRNGAVRAELGRMAEVVDAVRLPQETFEAHAATSPKATDLIVLRRRDADLDPGDAEGLRGSLADEAAWGPAPSGFGDEVCRAFLPGGAGHVVGSLVQARAGDNGVPRPHCACSLPGGTAADVARLLSGRLALTVGAAGLAARMGRQAAQAALAVEPDGPVERDRYMVGADGGVWLGSGDAWELAEAPMDPPGRLRRLVGLRDALDALYAIEADPGRPEGEVGAAIDGFRALYEGFVADYGRIDSQANRRAWDSRADRTWARVAALETWEGSGKERRLAGTADCMRSRVVRPAPDRPRSASGPAEALAVSLEETGGVDMARIAELLSTDALDARRQLGDRVLEDPEGRVRLAEEWLSGDLRARLDEVGRAAAGPAALLARADEAWLEHISSGAGAALRALAVPGTPTRKSIDLLAADGLWGPEVAGAQVATRLMPRVAYQTERGAMAMAYLDALAGSGRRPLDGDPRPVWDMLTGPSVSDWGSYVGDWRAPWGADPAERRRLDLATTLRAQAAVLARAARLCPDRLAPRALEDLARAMLGYCAGHEAAAEALAAWSAFPSAPLDPSALPARPSERHAALAEAARAVAREAAEDPSRCDGLLAAAERMCARAGAAAGRPGLGSAGADASPAAREAFMAAWAQARGLDLEGARAEAARLDALRCRVEDSMPDRLTRGEIRAELGASWVPADVYLDFAYHVLDVPPTRARDSSIEHCEGEGSWQLSLRGMDEWAMSEEARARWDVPRTTGEWPAWRLLDAAMNTSQVKIKNTLTGEVDAVATSRAQRLVSEMREEFRAWAFADEARAARLEEIYNRLHNTVAPRRYDGSFLKLSDASPAVTLRPHQRDAVARFLQAPEGTLLAHGVGTGKTYSGVACMHEAKRVGKLSKPLVVVPGPTMEGWVSSWAALYPRDRVLAMTDADSKGPAARERFWAAVRANDWDAVIVPDSAFDMVKLSPEVCEASARGRLARAEAEAAAAKANGLTAKGAERVRMRERNALDRERSAALRSGDVEATYFDQLGVDGLLVDEAHNYKNLPLEGKIDLPGVSASGSGKAALMRDKVEWLRSQGCGRNVLFLTGTPVSNSVSEVYRMQSYLAPGLLRSMGCATFSDWARSFGDVVASVEVDVTGARLTTKSRFARFVNLPELMQSYKVFADTVSSDEVDLDLPEVEVVPVAVKPTEAQREEVASLGERADEIRAGKVDPMDDNLLKVTGDGRNLAISMRLMHRDDPSVEVEPHGKLGAVADNVLEIWGRERDRRGVQLVFCDLGVPGKADRWSVYGELKGRLVAGGVPEREVRWVTGSTPKAERDALYAQARSGEVRVLMGSTQTLGTGVNVQDRLAAIHNVDCPWRPSDLEQRRGRIERQGNSYARVQVFHYVTEGTFDSYLYQTVERKQSFIAQLSADPAALAREAEDVDQEALEYAKIKELTVSDPDVRERTEVQNRVAELTLDEVAWARSQKKARDKVESLEESAAAQEAWIAHAEASSGSFARLARALDAAGGFCGVEVLGERHELVGESNRAVIAAAMALDTPNEWAEIGSYLGLTLMACPEAGRFDPGRAAPENRIRLKAVPELGGYGPTLLSMGKAETGAGAPLAQLDAKVRELAAGPQPRHREALEDTRARLEEARAAVGLPFPGAAELAAARARLAQMEEERRAREAAEREAEEARRGWAGAGVEEPPEPALAGPAEAASDGDDLGGASAGA